jgi:ABC-2 type transport system ATP-binding protein
MLTIEHVVKRYGKKEALHGVSAQLGRGVYGLLGANGSGKTTLLRCICGLFAFDEGKIMYQGERIDRSVRFRRELGYLPQSFGMFQELTLHEMLDYFCAMKKISSQNKHMEIDRVLCQVNLTSHKNARVSSLSGGMIRRAGIAQALLGNPQVIIMDEPTSGLDPEERARFKSVIVERNPDQLILISTHIVEDIDASCDRVLVIHEGRFLFKGTCPELKKIALNKVYQIKQSDVDNILGDMYIFKKTETQNGVYCRVLASENQEIESEAPTLEDGYMCLIKGLS